VFGVNPEPPPDEPVEPPPVLVPIPGGKLPAPV